MNFEMVVTSLTAFNQNAANHIAYSISTNWWFIVFVVAAVICVFMGIQEESASVVREEQNIL